MITAQPAAHGTAEQLARLIHFRALEDALPDAHELDPVIRFLIGRVDDAHELVAQLLDELDQLWSLITEDFDDDQLDELTDEDWSRHSFSTYQQEVDHRHSATVARLVGDIEGHISLARTVHAENSRPIRTAVAS